MSFSSVSLAAANSSLAVTIVGQNLTASDFHSVSASAGESTGLMSIDAICRQWLAQPVPGLINVGTHAACSLSLSLSLSLSVRS